jgi:Holliday junction resolvasome RuvABC ATP-dependent DNA helicase subunit
MSEVKAPDSVKSVLSENGISQEQFDDAAQTAEESPELQARIDELSKDGLTEEERDQIGADVADKALDKFGVNYDGLTDDQKMGFSFFCGKCLDTMANQSADKATASH